MCHSCWENQPPASLYAHWETEVLAPKKPKIMVDDAVLFDFFLSLEGTQEQTKIEFRYLLALMLMRKRFLSFDDMRIEDGVSLMSVTVRGGSRQDVIDPGISEEKIARLQKELTAVFTVDIAEKPQAVHLALPAQLSVDAKAEDLLDLAAEAGISQVVLNGVAVPLSVDIARCETIRDYAREKKIGLSLFQSSFRILDSSSWQKAFDPWLTHARALGSRMISVRCGFSAESSIDSQLPELIKRMRTLIKRSLRYKVLFVVESDELTNEQITALFEAHDAGSFYTTLHYTAVDQADELASQVIETAARGGYGVFPLADVQEDKLASWVRGIAAGGFNGVIVPAHLGVMPGSEELKERLEYLKKVVYDAQVGE
jgi:hypothetical protein